MVPDALDNQGWDELACAHLLSRAGFGANRKELAQWCALGRRGAVDRLIDWEKTPEPDLQPPSAAELDPEWLEWRRSVRKADPETRRELLRKIRQRQQADLMDLRVWWIQRMFASPRPLQEKMTLFWHNHFATSIVKVREPYFMWLQNDLFRRMGGGPFRELLLAVGRDPAMLIWLDGASSKAKAPNENYARELMELFTLGEGHYTEEDIRESARAYTGWSVDREALRAVFRPRWHDAGTKTFFGQTGHFRDEDIVSLILAHPEAPRFLCRKLWNFFVGTPLPASILDALAAKLREMDFNVREVLRVILMSQAFYAPETRGHMIKSPVDWVVSTFKLIECPQLPGRMAYGMARILGQDLFAPPSVKGWDGGRAWISTATLLTRNNLARLLVYGGEMDEVRQVADDPRMVGLRRHGDDEVIRQALAREGRKGSGARNRLPALVWTERIFEPEHRRDVHKLVESLTRTFFRTDPQERHFKAFGAFLKMGRRPSSDEVRSMIYLAMTHPEFQLM